MKDVHSNMVAERHVCQMSQETTTRLSRASISATSTSARTCTKNEIVFDDIVNNMKSAKIDRDMRLSDVS